MPKLHTLDLAFRMSRLRTLFVPASTASSILTTLLLFGGSATQEFVLALLIGIISGTYSSIFNAAPLLVVWQDWEDRRRGRLARPGARRATA